MATKKKKQVKSKLSPLAKTALARMVAKKQKVGSSRAAIEAARFQSQMKHKKVGISKAAIEAAKIQGKMTRKKPGISETDLMKARMKYKTRAKYNKPDMSKFSPRLRKPKKPKK